MSTLSKGITTFAYFVDWNKVDRLHKGVERELHLLDSLIGKQNLEKELDDLLQEYPKVARAFPSLLAVRHEPSESLRILTSYTGGSLTYEEFDLSGNASVTAEQRAKLVRFAKESGILDLFTNRVTKSLPDYHVGVEVGLDSNGRKNRGGSLMESVTWQMVQEMSKRRGWKCLQQANAAEIQRQWGIKVQMDKTASEPDISVLANGMLWVIETNYYNSGGSKLKATAGEYQNKFPRYEAQGHGCIWVTDGMGWLTAETALQEAFQTLPFVLNLELCGRGCLEDILQG